MGDARAAATQIFYSEANDSLLEWFLCRRTARAKLFTGNLVDLEGHLPVMADAERILLVEDLRSPYRPPSMSVSA